MTNPVQNNKEMPVSFDQGRTCSVICSPFHLCTFVKSLHGLVKSSLRRVQKLRNARSNSTPFKTCYLPRLYKLSVNVFSQTTTYTATLLICCDRSKTACASLSCSVSSSYVRVAPMSPGPSGFYRARKTSN